MLSFRGIRHAGRSPLTIILTFTTIISTLLTIHLYQVDRQRQDVIQHIPTSISEQSKNIPLSVTEKNIPADPSLPIKTVTNPFAHYSSDEHLLSLLQQHSNTDKQIIITIIGGDSYSLFAWDWYERMHEVSNITHKCHCFIVAMDEIAVVLAVKQNLPVYYSTFTFEQQLRWINTIEARQHSLYRVGHGKFNTAAKIVQMGYSVFLTEMDVFWKENPLEHLRKPVDTYDLQISDHFGSHPRVNIGLFFVRSTNASRKFFIHVAEFWLRYGKGAYLSDQRALDALLRNYDRLDKTYLKAMQPAPVLNWTTHAFGTHFSHLMTDGSAFILFNRAEQLGIRSKRFYGDVKTKYFTVTVSDRNMTINDRNLLLRSLLILQHTHLKNHTMILPAFSSNLATVTLFSQLDVKKFLLYWSDERIRLPNFLLHNKTQSIPVTNIPFSSEKAYNDINGILNFTIDSIPLNLPSPSAQFEVFVRDSLLWCSPPVDGGVGWCVHHPRDFGATMELLFACRGDPYPPCANKTEKNEQFLSRPFERTKIDGDLILIREGKMKLSTISTAPYQTIGSDSFYLNTVSVVCTNKSVGLSHVKWRQYNLYRCTTNVIIICYFYCSNNLSSSDHLSGHTNFPLGIVGGRLNFIVFLSLKTFRQNSCAFYLTIMSLVDVGYLITGLLTYIMLYGFGVD